MAKIKTQLITTKGQKKYRDHLFIAIFGRNNPQSKQWRLELYKYATQRASVFL